MFEVVAASLWLKSLSICIYKADSARLQLRYILLCSESGLLNKYKGSWEGAEAAWAGASLNLGWRRRVYLLYLSSCFIGVSVNL